MKKEKLDIVLVQQDIAWRNPQENYIQIEHLLANLQHPVDLIVAPETFNTGFGGEMLSLAEETDGPTFEFAKHIARRYNAVFAATWLVKEHGRLNNRLHFVSPDGMCRHYNKVHTFRMSSEFVQVNRGSESVIFEWCGWKIKVAICYDLRFPVFLRNHYSPNEESRDSQINECCGLDYDVLLLCANWPASRIAAWDTLLKARAIENVCYVVASNRTGTDAAELLYNGHSQVIDYKGNRIDDGQGDAPSLIYATLSASSINDFRRRWPFYLDADNLL